MFARPRTAPFALLVGLGVGMEQVAEYIRRNTGDCAQPVTVAAHMDVHLGHYDLGCAEVLPFWDDNGRISTADFLVTYVSQMQRHDGTTIHLLMNSIDRQPARTLTLHGIDYVHIYDLREDQQ